MILLQIYFKISHLQNCNKNKVSGGLAFYAIYVGRKIKYEKNLTFAGMTLRKGEVQFHILAVGTKLVSYGYACT